MTATTEEPRLRVLVDAAGLHMGGGATVAREQISALAQTDSVDLEVLCQAGLASDLAGLSLRTITLPRVPLVVRLLVEQVLLSWRGRRADVIYMPGNFAVLMTGRPQVLLLQNAYHFGGAARAVRRGLLPRRMRVRIAVEAWLARASVRVADRVLCVSQPLLDAVREDVNPGAAQVLRSAPPHLPDDGPTGLPTSVPQTYVLSVAHDYFHKDWDGLATAFEAHGDLPPLVLVGAPRSAERLRKLQTRAPRTHFLGRVDDRRMLMALHHGAACCVVHSWLESSSLTPLEALRAGRRVAATALPAHAELEHPDVKLYPPGDRAALAAAVRDALAESTPVAPAPGADWAEVGGRLLQTLQQAAEGVGRPPRRGRSRTALRRGFRRS